MTPPGPWPSAEAPSYEFHAQRGWDIVVAAAARAEEQRDSDTVMTFACVDGVLQPARPADANAVLAWRGDSGWEPLVGADDPRRGLLELWLPICSATRAQPMTVGHLGQSLDGFIATRSGDSHFVTGRENILHLHRMRALCDAVIVGAGTVAADDPQLTTRYVSGSNPLRVIFDPARRLAGHYRLFTDDTAATLYACARAHLGPDELQIGQARVLALADERPGAAAHELMDTLRARGCHRIFVEGGGVTVSAFLEGDLLDRLQIAIAPVIIGEGKPAIRLPPPATLNDCVRPRYRVFRMGGDVLFDCELHPRGGEEPLDDDAPAVRRVI